MPNSRVTESARLHELPDDTDADRVQSGGAYGAPGEPGLELDLALGIHVQRDRGVLLRLRCTLQHLLPASHLQFRRPIREQA